MIAALAIALFSSGEAKLEWSGFVHADAVALDQTSEDELDPATREPLNRDRLLIRRGHLRLDATRSFLGAAVELDANTLRGPALGLIAAEVTARWQPDSKAEPLLLGSIGLSRIPFGYETRLHDLLRPFLEQSTVNRALFPGSYQMELRGTASWKWLRWDCGALSGEPIGAARFAGRAPTRGVDLAGRGGVDTAIAPGIQLQVGISGLEGRGFHSGTPQSKDQLVWRDANEDGIVQISEIQVIPGSAATPSATFRRFALGADAHLSARLGAAGTLVMGGEWIWALNLDRALYIADPIASGRDAREVGYSASAVLNELPYGLALGLRYDHYNPDADAADQQAGVRVPFDASVSTLALMASVRVEKIGRFLIEYDRNHNAYGRGINGSPASLAADALTLRAELAF